MSLATRALLCLLLGLVPAPALAGEVQPTMTGDVRIHDPSVIEVDGRFAAFGTGGEGPTRGAIRTKTSPDGARWADTGVIGDGVPGWAKDALGYRPVDVWAPSVSRRGQTVFLYYALSTFGGNASAIGLMTSDAFDVAAPAANWTDRGLVLKSDPRDDFNAIDPFRIDLSDGRAFLAFGSFWSGIKLRELDPASGRLIRDDTPTIPLASRHRASRDARLPTGYGGAIEAASILEHDGRFYLFVSFDQCCKGVASTYNIRVGRADRIEGPYVDRRDGRCSRAAERSCSRRPAGSSARAARRRSGPPRARCSPTTITTGRTLAPQSWSSRRFAGPRTAGRGSTRFRNKR